MLPVNVNGRLEVGEYRPEEPLELNGAWADLKLFSSLVAAWDLDATYRESLDILGVLQFN